MGIIFILLGLVLIFCSLYLKYLQMPEDSGENISGSGKLEVSAAEAGEQEGFVESGDNTGPRLEARIEELAAGFQDIVEEVHASRQQFEARLDKLLTEIEKEEDVPRFKDYLEDRLSAVAQTEPEQVIEDTADRETDSEVTAGSDENDVEEEVPSDGPYEMIFSRYQKGKEPEEIAEELGLGIRETRLILKFHRKGGE
ncbi:MAG: hypothetical protein ACOCZM_01450 [Bacillota bacterium]